MKNNLSKLAIGLLIIICGWYGKNLNPWGKNQVIQNDVVSYYAYLPAAFIFGDLDFDFVKGLPGDFEGKIWLATAPSGKKILRMTMGLAFLWSPFFIMAHGLAHLTGASTLGYSWPYSLFIFIAALFYLFVGLLFLRKILLLYFSDLITAITLLAVVVGTNLMYYVISEPGMAHVYNFCLITVFLFFSIKWTEEPTWKLTLLSGFIAGLIALIRPVNIVVLLFPLLIGTNNQNNFAARIKNHFWKLLVAGIVAFIVVLPQIIYWKLQTGHFLFNSYMESGKFYFLDPQIINGLFSYRKGWLLYTPVMVLGLLGLLRLKKYAPTVLLPVVLFLIIDIYIVFSWWCWWYGGSFGARPMIDAYGVMAIPLAAFFESVGKSRNWLRATVAVLLVGLIALNQFQMKQYRTSLLHWDCMTKEAYWGIFLKKGWPEGYDKMIKNPDYNKALKGENEY